jgi:hypothetical protein
MLKWAASDRGIDGQQRCGSRQNRLIGLQWAARLGAFYNVLQCTNERALRTP